MNTEAIVRLSAAVVVTMLLISCAPSGMATKGDGDALDPVMGDWQGHLVAKSGMVSPITVQAIALGENRYHFNVRENFDQPDAKWDPGYDARLEGDRLVFPKNPDWQIRLADGIISGRTTWEEARLIELRHVVRLSPALGAKPPEGAVVLFDGTSLGGWERREVKERTTPVGWKIEDGILKVEPGTGDIVTKRHFTNFQLHVEFRTPFMPEARGQDRGNSGVYLQGRYEIQVLDSYGLKSQDNECGGIYKVGAPRVNMCAPPGQWQSYDATFHAPRFDQDGKKTREASVTVLHNGVPIHKDLPVPGPTGGALDKDVQLPGGILLQDHGNFVQYRNIWLVELKD